MSQFLDSTPVKLDLSLKIRLKFPSPPAGGPGAVRLAAEVDDDDGAAVGADDQEGRDGVRGGAQA